MSYREAPDLQIPFSKEPWPVGYCLSCYRSDGGPVYSIPLEASTRQLLDILDRSNVINGDALTKAEFVAVFPLLVGSNVLCWYDDLEFVIEGQNLPLGWEDR